MKEIQGTETSRIQTKYDTDRSKGKDKCHRHLHKNEQCTRRATLVYIFKQNPLWSEFCLSEPFEILLLHQILPQNIANNLAQPVTDMGDYGSSTNLWGEQQ